MSNSLWPHKLYSLWNSPGQNTGVGSPTLLQGTFPTQRSNPALPHCSGFFTSWATVEAQEYWNGSPILFPEIFSTQESNWGLLHCRQILYQLSYQGSPITVIKVIIIFDQYFLSVVYVSAMCVYVLSYVRLFVTPWSLACQAPLSMEFSRQEYWSGLPFPASGCFR